MAVSPVISMDNIDSTYENVVNLTQVLVSPTEELKLQPPVLVHRVTAKELRNELGLESGSDSSDSSESDIDQEVSTAEKDPGDNYSEDEDKDVETSESDSSSARTKKRKKKSFKVKRSEVAEKNFIRKNGNIYVSTDVWAKYCRFAFDCQIYISSMSTVASTLAGQGQVNTTTKTTTNEYSSSCLSSKPSLTGEHSPHLAFYLPDKIRFCNDLLCKEMGAIIGNNDLNHDHVSPYRSIIPFEKQFRILHEAKEKEFKALSASYPQHRAVQRSEPWLPRALSAYLFGKYEDKTDALDKVRILLDGLRALVSILDNELADLVDCYNKIQTGTILEIPFVYLWHLFTAGQEIVSRKPNYQVYRVLKLTGGRKSLVSRQGIGKMIRRRTSRRTFSDFTIDCFYLDFDGKNFRAVPHVIRIQPYEGLMDITTLVAHPLSYEKGDLQQRLIERGVKFADLTLVAHRRYRGLSLKEGDLFIRHEEIDSDVMIDFELAFRNSEPRIELPRFESGVITTPSEENEEEANELNGFGFDDDEYYNARWFDFLQSTNLLEAHSMDTRERDVMILLSYRVYGYVLLNRKWYPLDIDLVQPVISGNQDRFDKLILPRGHKDIVRALVKTHARVPSTARNDKSNNLTQREFDIVKGKGKGLIILLHGAPGVGKTSTAECVAVNTGRPLFHITCGDIAGSTAQDVERNLESFFDLARKWGCVLLLDEADVFLSERTKGDIRQNSLVSVFLRVLEYYSGILILTTNRVGDFDEAIKSRVHCALYYPPLSRANTLDVWKMNTELLQSQNSERTPNIPIQFEAEEIMQFARDHWKEGNRWNGRQIKNAFQTAVALADWDHLEKEKKSKPKLKRKHFEKVAAASAHFDRYLVEVRTTDQTRAKMNEVRRDDLDNDLKGWRSRYNSKGKSSRDRKSSVPQWPNLDDEEGESTTDASQSESEVEEEESESESESEPIKKKSRNRDEGGKKTKKDENMKVRRSKKDGLKNKSKDKSLEIKSSKKSSKQESKSANESRSESEESDSGSD